MAVTRRFALSFIVIAVTITPSVSLAGQRAFEGAYVASGVDAAGNEYRRAVEIERHGDRFVVVWVAVRVIGQVLVLEPTWVGVGIATGDTLSVSFIADDVLGIMVYRFAPDGKQLSGRWTLEGEEEATHSETLTPLADVLPSPTNADPPEQELRPSSARAIGVLSL